MSQIGNVFLPDRFGFHGVGELEIGTNCNAAVGKSQVSN